MRVIDAPWAQEILLRASRFWPAIQCDSQKDHGKHVYFRSDPGDGVDFNYDTGGLAYCGGHTVRVVQRILFPRTEIESVVFDEVREPDYLRSLHHFDPEKYPAGPVQDNIWHFLGDRSSTQIRHHMWPNYKGKDPWTPPIPHKKHPIPPAFRQRVLGRSSTRNLRKMLSPRRINSSRAFPWEM